MKQDSLKLQVTRCVVTLVGGAVGLGLATLTTFFWRLLNAQGMIAKQATGQDLWILHIAIIFFSLLIAFLCSRRIATGILEWLGTVERRLDARPMPQLIAGAVGLVLGLVLALLLTQLLGFMEPGLTKTLITVVLYLVLGYLGLTICARRWREIVAGIPGAKRGETRRRETPPPPSGAYSAKKILDTSVIIDGRIFDLCKTGFIEGILVVPEFVLRELQHIADSSDALRRNRGRRGLDVLQRIREELPITVEIEQADYPEVDEVDVKLLKLAQEIGGLVMTNDYNLNKVASLSGVKVLNINELAGALRPVVLHGEEMLVQIVREGKEPGQGVAYLDDGTMIVVDNGKSHVGETLEVLVTTVLQTAAGRMIFTKIKGEDGDKAE